MKLLSVTILSYYQTIYIPVVDVDVVEWSRALDVRLSEWCCSVSMVWVQIRRGKNKNLTALKSNLILTLFGLIFRRIYIYIYIYVTWSFFNSIQFFINQCHTTYRYTYIQYLQLY